MHSEVFSKASL